MMPNIDLTAMTVSVLSKAVETIIKRVYEGKEPHTNEVIIMSMFLLFKEMEQMKKEMEQMKNVVYEINNNIKYIKGVVDEINEKIVNRSDDIETIIQNNILDVKKRIHEAENNLKRLLF